MGIGVIPQQLLTGLLLKLSPGFSVCELGDQLVATPKRRLDKPSRWVRVPACDFYIRLGCGCYKTIDANGKADILADLNYPLRCCIGPFDLVTNWGTTEHVFDQAQCWRTIHDLTEVGGYIAGEQPFIGYKNHGFYSFHPTLIKGIAAANDYRVEHFSTPEMERGMLVRYVLQRMKAGEFKVPTQGKYVKSLKI